MKAAPLLISWHNDGQPVWSAHFEPNGKGRLATSGGDGNVRLWRVEEDGDGRKVTYLSTLVKVRNLHGLVSETLLTEAAHRSSQCGPIRPKG